MDLRPTWENTLSDTERGPAAIAAGPLLLSFIADASLLISRGAGARLSLSLQGFKACEENL